MNRLRLLTSSSSSKFASLKIMSIPSRPLGFLKPEIAWNKVTILAYIKLVRICQFEDHVHPSQIHN